MTGADMCAVIDNGAANLSARPPIRVMIVDDSNIARSVFATILGRSDEIRLVCEADSAESALSCLEKQTVDIILLDIKMPRRSGLEILPELLVKSKGARILIVSSFVEENGPAAVAALSLGACDTLSKPGRTTFSGQFSRMLLDKVKKLGRNDPSGDERSAQGNMASVADRLAGNKPACIAIGASTGGISVIFDLVSGLGPDLSCPIFITQHLPDTFMPFFARQLSSRSGREVCVAVPGMRVRSGVIYIAPGNSHLTCVDRNGIILVGDGSGHGVSPYSPSVDVMLSSLCDIYGSNALAIVLSGMGNDGLSGAHKISKSGGTIIVQDKDSSVIWGMPGAVARAGLASAILPSAGIASLLGGLQS